LFFAVLSLYFNVIIGDFIAAIYIKAMNLLKLAVCILLMFCFVGCSVSKNPNPVIRYGANTGTTLAMPGLIMAGVDPRSNHVHASSFSMEMLALELVGYSAAGIGFATGAVLGGTVGFFKWMINGFENDRLCGSLPENVYPPEAADDETDKR
jgi:hypothetical protein